jgi:uncharacterized membrane protein YgdD (TMEM256/DUF423 family)
MFFFSTTLQEIEEIERSTMDQPLPAAPTPKTIVDAASYALVHTAAALAVGMAIENIVPGLSEDEEATDTLLRAAAQVLANGICVFAAAKILDSSQDPTGGILFTWALMVSQPTLSARLHALSSQLVDAASQQIASLRSGAREAEAPSR